MLNSFDEAQRSIYRVDDLDQVTIDSMGQYIYLLIRPGMYVDFSEKHCYVKYQKHYSRNLTWSRNTSTDM
jgi:hypothetical protein